MWEPDTSSPKALAESIVERLQTWNLPTKDLAAAKSCVRRFEEALASPQADRGALAQAALDAFPLEKKHMTRQNAQVLPGGGLPRALLATVGTRPEPVILDVLTLNPRRVYLLPSSAADSVKAAEAVKADPDITRRNTEFEVHSIHEDDAAANYRLLANLLQGVNDDLEWWADPTGGRKMMSASLAAVVFHQRLSTMYLLAPEYQGLVWPFSGRLRIVESPYDHFDDIEVNAVLRLFHAGAYDEAKGLCDQLREAGRNAGFRRWVWRLRDLAHAYDLWDRFLHSRADQPVSIRQLLEDARDALADCLSPSTAEQIDKNLAFLESLEAATQRGAANMCDEYRLIDILVAAERRESQKRYDDAVARLYRACEMAASMVLRRYGLLSTEKPTPHIEEFAKRVGKAPEALFDNLPVNRGLGLDNQMQLLERAEVAVDLVRAYRERLQPALPARNRSVLAHGTNTIGDSGYQRFRAAAREIARCALPAGLDLDGLLTQARHPRLDGLRRSC